VLAFDEALEKLAAHDSFKAEVVKMRYFLGLSQGLVYWPTRWLINYGFRVNAPAIANPR